MRRKGILFLQKEKINVPAKAASFSPECVCLRKGRKGEVFNGKTKLCHITEKKYISSIV